LINKGRSFSDYPPTSECSEIHMPVTLKGYMRSLQGTEYVAYMGKYIHMILKKSYLWYCIYLNSWLF